MSGKRSVSAVMFVYNEALFIREQLDSVLRQSILPEKIIVIDDQSTDDTKAIVQEYIAKHPATIEYFYNPVKGKVNALALGLGKVKTQYYFVCAGDDILSDYFIETNLSVLEANPSDMFVYNWYIPFYKPFTYIELPLQQPQISKIDFSTLLTSNVVGGTIFADAAILKELLPLKENLPFEDWYISLRLASKYQYCLRNNVPTVLYRKHAESDSANLNYSKEKFVKLLQRDLKLFAILEQDASFTDLERKQIRNKTIYLENMLHYNPAKALKVLFNPQFPVKERLKSLIYPIVKRAKYRN